MLFYTKIISISILLITGFSCTSAKLKRKSENKEVAQYQRRETDLFYRNSRFKDYFLPYIPNWANFSQGSKCHRYQAVRYFHLENMQKAFNFSFQKALLVQRQFNIDYFGALKNSNAKSLSLKEEEKLFQNIYSKVNSGLLKHDLPNYKRVHLIWIDPALFNDKYMNRLVSKMDVEPLNLGYPVFVSMCLSYHELTEVVKKFNLSQYGAKLVTSEMLTVFPLMAPNRRFMHIDFRKLFSGQQKIYFYTPYKNLPDEFLGTFTKRKY